MTEAERKLISNLGNRLNEIAQNDSLGQEYLEICACALEIIETWLGDSYDFPIDVYEIARKMEISVIHQPLNEGTFQEENRQHYVVGQNLKRMNRITKEQVSNILIDSDSGRSEQRYALTHELAHYLIHYQETRYSNTYCVMPMLFKEMEEMVADVFATFLLIPLPIFLKEFKTYIGKRPVPIKTSDWLRYLSIVAEIPYEYVAIGYQNMRYVCAMLYKIREKRKYGEEDCKEKKLEEVQEKVQSFQDNPRVEQESSISDIVKKWTDRMLEAMTEEVVEKLFC